MGKPVLSRDACGEEQAAGPGLGLEAGTGKMAVDGRRLVAGPALDGRNGGAVPAGPATGSSRPDGTYLLPLLNIHCLDIYGLCTTI
jgi:hypothetical protein